MIAAAVRHGKDQTGLMLDKCTQWLRLLVSFAQLSTIHVCQSSMLYHREIVYLLVNCCTVITAA